MSYKMIITQKPTYLHAVITGLNTRENVERYLEELQGECIGRGCYRVLIEERLEGPRLRLMDVFQIVDDRSSRAHGIFEAIAFVDVYAESDMMMFAETVAVNRAIPVKIFSSAHDAEQWLLNSASGDEN